MAVNYNPMQYSLARAQVVDQGIRGTASAVMNFTQNIGKVLKQKDINERLNTAYKTAVEGFVNSAVESDPEMTREKASIAAARFFSKPTPDLDAETNIKLLLDASTRAETQLEKIKAGAVGRQKTKGAQAAVEPQRRYGLERDTGQGFTEADVIDERPAPQYQEEAIGRYGESAATGGVPAQTAQELRDQPSIAALPKTPEPLTAYQKWQMRFKEDQAQRESIAKRQAKGDMSSKELDKNLRYVMTKETDYLAGAKSNTEKASKLKSAIIKLKTQMENNKPPLLDASIESDLRSSGYDGGTDLNSLERGFAAANKMVMDSKAEAKRFGKMAQELSKGSSLPEAYQAGGTPEQARDEVAGYAEALQFIQTKLAPTLSGVHGTVNQILNQLPETLRPVIQEKVEQAKARGYSDFQIKEILLKGKIR